MRGDNKTKHQDRRLILTVVGIALLGYILISPSGFSLGDGPELTASASILGIPHPPGYPVFTNLGHLFAAPFLGGLWGLRLLNILAVSIAAGFIFACLRVLEVKRLSAFLGAVLFSASTIAVRGAIFVEVYGLALLGLSVVVWALLKSAGEDTTANDLLALTLCYGLALAHHLTLIFLAPAVFYILVRFARRNRPPVKFYALVVIAGLIGLSAYLYLPVRTAAGPAIAWFKPDNLERLGFVLSGASYGEFWGVGGGYFWNNVGLLGDYMLRQLPVYLVLASLIGLILLARRRLWLTVLLVAGALINLWWAAKYASIVLDVFFLLGSFIFLFASIYAVGRGIERIFTFVHEKSAFVFRLTQGTAFVVVFFLAVTGFLQSSHPDDLAALPHGRNLLRCPPSGGVIVFKDDLSFPVLHHHYAAGRRPDLVVVDESGMITTTVVQNRAIERTVNGAFVFNADPAGNAPSPPTARWGYGRLFPPDTSTFDPITPQRYLERIEPGGVYADEVAARYLLARLESRDGYKLWDIIGPRASEYAGASPHAHLDLGRWLLEKNPAAARDEFLNAVELNPWMPSARFNLALAELALGNVAAARVELEAALEGFAEPEVKEKALSLLFRLR